MGFDPVTKSAAVKDALEKLGVKIKPKKVILDVDVTDGVWNNSKVTTLEVGRTYAVRGVSGSIDITFEEVCKEADGCPYLGNLYLLEPEGYDDTGEEFLVASFGDDTQSFTYVILKGNANAHVTVTALKTIHPIKKEFLPGVCLPVVELGTVIASGATFTEEENAKLTAAAERKMAIIIKGTFHTYGVTFTDVAAIATFSTLEGIPIFVVSVGDLTAEFAFNSGSWGVKLS